MTIARIASKARHALGMFAAATVLLTANAAFAVPTTDTPRDTVSSQTSTTTPACETTATPTREENLL